MAQLTVGDILILIHKLVESGMEKKDISNLPIYIGNDDELNGIHCAWYGQMVDVSNDEDKYLIELINEDHHNIKLSDKGILIS